MPSPDRTARGAERRRSASGIAWIGSLPTAADHAEWHPEPSTIALGIIGAVVASILAKRRRATASLATGTGLTINLGLGIDYLIVGGGGGGGSLWGGGGGAVRSNVGGTALPQTPGSYGVTIGAGGTGATTQTTRGDNGGSSVIFGLSASGGGGGGSYRGNTTPRENVGGSGASGGGSAPTDDTNTPIGGGTGTAGNNGGSGFYLSPPPAPDYNLFRGGGGGGSAYLSTGVVSGGTGGSGVVIIRYRNATDVSSGGDTSGTYSDGSNTWYYEQFTNSGTLALTAANSYSGGTTISAGTLQIGASGTTGSLGTGAVTNGGELVFDRSDSVTVSNAISGSGGLVHAGAGTTTLAGNNTYAGPTTIAAGRLVGSTASLPGAIANASQLEFAQASTGTFTSGVSGAGSLAKTGAGNLILSGSSSYSGATSVAAGRLSVNGILGDTPVAVLAAAELGGSGSITGSVSISSGGFLSPGNSIASLASGTASFAAGATFAYEVDSTDPLSLGSAADLLVVSGDLNLDLGNASLLTLADLASSIQPFVEDTTIFAMINYSGAWNGGLFTYGGNVLTDGSRFTVGSQQWEIDYNRTSSAGLANFTADYLPSSSFVTVTAVPEPATLALVAFGAALAALVARRRS